MPQDFFWKFLHYLIENGLRMEEFQKKNFVAVSTYDKPQISSIFHFDQVSDCQMAHVLGVKGLRFRPFYAPGPFTPTLKNLKKIPFRHVNKGQLISNGLFGILNSS